MGAASGGVVGLHIPLGYAADAAVHGLSGEAVQRYDPAHQVGEPARDRRVPSIRVAEVAVDCVVVDGGMEGALDLVDRAGKNDGPAPLGNLVDGKAMGVQPTGYRRDLLLPRAELPAEFLGGQPTMVVYRARVVLFDQGFLQGRLVIRGAPQ